MRTLVNSEDPDADGSTSTNVGLNDAREAALLRRLRSEAAALAGELVLGHLCEAAQVGPTRCAP